MAAQTDQTREKGCSAFLLVGAVVGVIALPAHFPPALRPDLVATDHQDCSLAHGFDDTVRPLALHLAICGAEAPLYGHTLSFFSTKALDRSRNADDAGVPRYRHHQSMAPILCPDFPVDPLNICSCP